eukprot:620122-Prymnesium_polylepis.1
MTALPTLLPAHLLNNDADAAVGVDASPPREERFHRGLGAIRTRARGAAHLAKTSEGDPSNHGEAMRDDPFAWGQSEISEIGNHEGKGSWSYIIRV